MVCHGNIRINTLHKGDDDDDDDDDDDNDDDDDDDNNNNNNNNNKLYLSWLTRLVAGLTPRRSGFGSMPILVGFLVDKVELGQVPVSVLRFFVSVIPSTIRTHSFTCHRRSLILVNDSVVK